MNGLPGRGIVMGLCVLMLTALAASTQELVSEQDVVYRTAGGETLTLDLVRPSGEGPYPLLVFIHGGGWQRGSKRQYAVATERYARRGYVAASVQYRFADKHPFPAQLHDVKCAVVFLKTHAEQYRIDPGRVAAMGNSAGGHLTLMLALTDPEDGFEACEHDEMNSSIQAAINLYGPADFPAWEVDAQTKATFGEGFGKSFDAMLDDLVGTHDRADPRMRAVSPVTYIDPGDPPVLSFHGEKDKLVPPSQAVRLHAVLRQAGVEEQLILVEDAGHGWSGDKLAETHERALAFLDATFEVQHTAP